MVCILEDHLMEPNFAALQESVNNSLSNLLSFPFIKRAVSLGTLKLHGWYYDFVASRMSTWTFNLQMTDYEHLE